MPTVLALLLSLPGGPLPAGPLALAGAALVACGTGLACVEGDGAAAHRGGTGGAGEPFLHCAAPEVDLGTAWEGTLLLHEFVLDVPAAEGLVVEGLRADCGCTLARLEVEEHGPGGVIERRPYTEGEALPSGGRLFVEVRYDTRGKRGAAPRAISLYGSFPGGRTVLSLSADVRPWLVCEPDRLELGRLSEKDAVERRLRVTTPTGEPFRLHHERKGVPDAVVLELEPVEPGADGRSDTWSVLARFGPGLPRGAHGYPLYLLTDVRNPDAAPELGPTHHGVTPQAVVQVTGPVSLSPPALAFGLVRPGETVARTLRVTGHDEHELGEPEVRLELLRAGAAGVDAGAGANDPSGGGSSLADVATISTRAVPGENAWDVQVLFDGLDEHSPGTTLARLVIETGHPEEPPLEAPLTLQVAAR